MLKKIATGLVTAALVAGTALTATSAADAKPYWKYPHENHYYYHRNNGGDAVAAGILGFIGGAFLSQAARPYAYDYGYPSGYPAGYCATRFRTFDPASHTYMGYDGHRHYCYD